MTNMTQSFPLEELARLGKKFYLEELKEKLEKNNFGQFVVIDVEQKKYEVDESRLIAIQKAQKEFGEKLFYIVQIGNIQHNVNFSAARYAWNF